MKFGDKKILSFYTSPRLSFFFVILIMIND